MKWKPNEYFKKVAISHILLQHTEKKPAYFREYSSVKMIVDNSDFLLKMRTASERILVSIFNGSKNFAENIDNNTRTNTGSIFLLKKIKSITEIDFAKEELEEIMEDIISKIKKEIRSGELQLFGFSVYVSAIGMIGDNYYGLAAHISYGDVYCHYYNSEKWV